MTKRIGVYDWSAESQRRTERAVPSEDERRYQVLIRRALDKCRNNQADALTLRGIDLIIGCYDRVAQREDLSEEDTQLLDLINRAIDQICTKWSRLETLRKAKSAREDA